MIKSIFMLLLLTSEMLFTSSAARAFTLVLNNSGAAADGWSSSTVTFDIDTSCNGYLPKVYEAIGVASNTWGAVPTSSLKIQSGSMVTLPHPITTYVGNSATSYAPVGNPIIYCDSNFQADSGANANNIPGFATGYNLDSSGKIVGSLLVLNVQAGAQANISTLDPTLLSVVLTHEIGHCLGLGHSADSEALMYYQTGAGRQTVLAQDDIDGITYLYPKQEMGNSFLGCASISTLYPRRGGGGGARGGALSFFKTVGPDLMLLILFLALLHGAPVVSKRRWMSRATQTL